MAASNSVRRGFLLAVLCDALAAFLAYLFADFLRCFVWMRTSWPEHVEGHGSMLSMHLTVAAFLFVGWPVLLHLNRWYRPIVMPSAWVLSRLLFATALAGMLISAASLLYERDVYPRAQIGFVVVCLPLVSLLSRRVTASSSMRKPIRLKDVPDPATTGKLAHH